MRNRIGITQGRRYDLPIEGDYFCDTRAMFSEACGYILCILHDMDTCRATESIQRPGPKEKEEETSLRMKRAESFQGLELNFGKLTLAYFIMPTDLIKHCALWSPLEVEALGEFPSYSSLSTALYTCRGPFLLSRRSSLFPPLRQNPLWLLKSHLKNSIANVNKKSRHCIVSWV